MSQTQKQLGFISLSVLVMGLLGFIGVTVFKSSLIISIGIKAVKTLSTLMAGTIALGALGVLAVGAWGVFLRHKQKQQEVVDEEAQKDPFYGQAGLVILLNEEANDPDNNDYLRHSALRAVKQLEQAESLMTDYYDEFMTGNQNPVLDTIANELVAIRKLILSDAKKVKRFIIFNDEHAETKRLLDKNDDLLLKAKDLISEVILYLDKKDGDTTVDLDTLITSLKELTTLV